MMISSLGDGFDENSLVAVDRRMDLWFLEGVQEDSSRKPTDAEIQHYEKSIILRKTALRKASNHNVVIDRLSDKDYANEDIYDEFHQDMKKYPYAWQGIIFDSKEQLPHASSALEVLKHLAWLKYEKRELEIFKDLMVSYGEALEIFETVVSDAKDEGYYEIVGAFKAQRYELNCLRRNGWRL